MKHLLFIITIFFLSVPFLNGQNLSPFWEELTASDFALAVKKSEGVCVIPIGVIEKHGQHLPLGTDVLDIREICRRAAAKEYCIIFPSYYAGQINEAKNQAGTVAYSSELRMRLLEETCNEISRNGIKKIFIVNGHGGNPSWLQYFCNIQLEKSHDYAVYYVSPYPSEEDSKRIAEKRKSKTGGHADEIETSTMLANRPDLVKLERATSESGENRSQLQHLPTSLSTGIRWYSQYPNHYAGDAKDATAELGEINLESRSKTVAELIKAIKADQTTLRLQNEFFEETINPLKTKVK